MCDAPARQRKLCISLRLTSAEPQPIEARWTIAREVLGTPVVAGDDAMKMSDCAV